MFTESLPSGRVRGGFKLAGAKFARTFDYEFEAVAWAEDAESRARAALTLGQPFRVDKASGALIVGDAETPAPTATPIVVEGTGPTFGAYAKKWIAARRGHLATGTISGYETHLKAIATYEINRIRLDVMTKEHVDSWVTDQVDDEVGRPTINARLKVLRMVLKYAVVNRVPGALDASHGVAFLPTDAAPDRWLSWEEDARLLAACRTPEEVGMVLAGLDAGLRWEEAHALDVDCRDPFGNLTVRQVVERDTRTIRRYPKSKKPRVVPMTDRLAVALDVLIEKARAEGRDLLVSVVTETENEDGTTTRTERPVDYWNNRRDVWRPICHAAKVNLRIAGEFKRLRFHDLRHTFGTRLAQAGVPSREIMELMGHADEKTTQRYTHAGNIARRGDLLRGALTVAATDGVVDLHGARETRKTA